MNIGKQHVKLCVGFDMGHLTPKQLELEVKRGVYDREELVSGPPWKMDVDTQTAAQRIVRSIKIPGWKGGKLPKVYAQRGLRFVKMDQWKQLVCGDVGIYTLCMADAFSSQPAILTHWCKVFFHNGRKGLEKLQSTLQELNLFQARSDSLHAEHEYRFPLRSLTSARHYDTHDPLSFKLAGNRKVIN
jgi:hypothetical protein